MRGPFGSERRGRSHQSPLRDQIRAVVSTFHCDQRGEDRSREAIMVKPSGASVNSHSTISSAIVFAPRPPWRGRNSHRAVARAAARSDAPASRTRSPADGHASKHHRRYFSFVVLRRYGSRARRSLVGRREQLDLAIAGKMEQTTPGRLIEQRIKGAHGVMARRLISLQPNVDWPPKARGELASALL